jgi:tetratricopeptide (TPR) repeat protein
LVYDCISFFTKTNDNKSITIAIGNTASIFFRLEMFSYALYLWKVVLTKYIDPKNKYLVNVTKGNIMMTNLLHFNDIVYSLETIEDIIYYYKQKKDINRSELYLMLSTKHNLARFYALQKNNSKAIEIMENLIEEYIKEEIISDQINVYYELGYAHAKGKECILVKLDSSEIPFDLKHHRHIIYKNVVDLKNRLKEELEEIKRDIEKIKKSKIQVSFKIKNEKLIVDDYCADFEADLIFDLNNDSETDSPEINGIYIYTGPTSEIYEGNFLCGSTKSDSPNFTMMHQITPSKNKLAKGQWHQIKVKTKKRLADKFAGDEIKHEYNVSGRLKFRLLTNKGVFDYEFTVNIDVDEIPF